MRIAVYSGSFNPLHIGHLAIMKALSRDGEFDSIYLVVSPQNPLKTEESLLTGRERFEAACKAVAKYPDLNVKVDDIELSMPAPQYTIYTLEELTKREPENEFTLIIGADNLERMRHWRDYRKILRDYGIVVYPREGFDSAALREALLTEDSSYKIRLLDERLVNVSSTDIREAQLRGENTSGLLM